jgi:hypothetical protein
MPCHVGDLLQQQVRQARHTAQATSAYLVHDSELSSYFSWAKQKLLLLSLIPTCFLGTVSLFLSYSCLQ